MPTSTLDLTMEQRMLLPRVRARGNELENLFGSWLTPLSIGWMMHYQQEEGLPPNADSTAERLYELAKPMISRWTRERGGITQVIGHALAVGVNLRMLLGDQFGCGPDVATFEGTLREHAVGIQTHCQTHGIVARLGRDALLNEGTTGEARVFSPLRISDDYNAFACMGLELCAMLERYGLEDRFHTIKRSCERSDGDWLLLSIAARERDKRNGHAWLTALAKGECFESPDPLSGLSVQRASSERSAG